MVKPLNKGDVYNLGFHNYLVDYLKEYYPIERIKDKKKFKRAILINYKPIFLSNTESQTLFNSLTTELYNMIGADPELLGDAVFDYLYS